MVKCNNENSIISFLDGENTMQVLNINYLIDIKKHFFLCIQSIKEIYI